MPNHAAIVSGRFGIRTPSFPSSSCPEARRCESSAQVWSAASWPPPGVARRRGPGRRRATRAASTRDACPRPRDTVQRSPTVHPDTRVMRLADGRDCVGRARRSRRRARVHFHGSPGSAVPVLPVAAAATDAHVRLISLDRPGYGRSSYHGGRTFADFARDVGQLADHLELDTLAVAGHSSGGPHAAACARFLRPCHFVRHHQRPRATGLVRLSRPRRGHAGEQPLSSMRSAGAGHRRSTRSPWRSGRCCCVH